VIIAAVLGIAAALALWWVYFDVAALVAAQRLEATDDVTARNELARDAFSYLHLPMVAAIVLVALGLKTTLAHVHDPLSWEATTALVGGAALYLVAHVAFKRRSLGTLSMQRLVTAVVLLAFIPAAHRVDAVVTVGVVAAVLWLLVAYETVRFAEDRVAIRGADHN
jgi:low temperature requirement protein LtrA